MSRCLIRRTVGVLIGLGCWLGGVRDLQAIPSAATRSISASQQFVVYCDNRDLRQQLAGAFDEIRTRVFAELGVRAGIRVSIVVNVIPRPTNQPDPRSSTLVWMQTPAGPRIDLELRLDDNSRNVRLQERIIEALLLTLKYRDQSPSQTDKNFVSAPGWMIEGLAEKLKWRAGKSDPAVYRSLLNSPKIPDLGEFFSENPTLMDSTALGIYRAYAHGLLALLQDQPSGKAHLLEYLKKVPGDRSQAVKLLGATFPDIQTTRSSMLKWWSLSLAKLSASDRYALLSAAETDRQLTDALNFSLPQPYGLEPKRYSIEQFDEFVKSKETRTALGTVSTNLLRITLRGNPLYRPVLGGYQEAVAQLQRGKSKGMAEKLGGLADLRQQILRRVEDVSDYLNWMEATQMPSKSGEFDGYLDLVRSYEQPRKPSTEPIGKYLDALEEELK